MSNDTTEEASRERLLRAAAQLFAENGFEGTSVKELAQLADVNVSLVSYHFGGKEGLFKACLEQFGKEGLGITERILKAPASAEELKLRLKMFIEEVIAIHLAKPHHTRILHRECDLQSSIAQDVFRTTFHPIFESLATFIESARKNHLLKQDLNPSVAATLLIGAMLHPIRMQRQASEFLGTSVQDAPYRDQVVEHLVTLFLRGFAL